MGEIVSFVDPAVRAFEAMGPYIVVAASIFNGLVVGYCAWAVQKGIKEA